MLAGVFVFDWRGPLPPPAGSDGGPAGRMPCRRAQAADARLSPARAAQAVTPFPCLAMGNASWNSGHLPPSAHKGDARA